MNSKIFVSILAVFVNLFLAVGKLFIGFISKSGAIFADGINSATDVFSSLVGFVGLKVAEKPADKEHPYGHGRAEVISGFVITLIIFVSGIFIIFEAIQEFFNPSLLALTTISFWVMGISAGINGGMSWIKVHFGKKYNSVSLISDGIHSRIDLFVSLAIFVGLFFTKYYSRLDTILALFVGLYILRESWILGREMIHNLMGGSAGEEVEAKIREVLKKRGVVLNSLKTQKLGDKDFAELNISLPSRLKVEKAEEFVKSLEKSLSDSVAGLEYLSIQISSHDVGTGYHRLGNFDGFGGGPGGYCVCPKGDYKIKHERGKPCSSLKCPTHKVNLVREKDE